MSSFSASALEKKIGEVTATQQSIQTLALWLIHHRKHAKTIIQVWKKELLKAKPKKKLTLMYLANDVLQNSRKKGHEFAHEFSHALPLAFHHCAKECDESTVSSLDRMLSIWRERDVYDHIFIERLKRGMVITSGFVEEEESPPEKKSKLSDLKKPENAPDPDDLIQRLQELEHSASQDAVVREKIANLPSEITDPSYFDKVDDVEVGKRVLGMLDDACELLAEYNARLAEELEERQKVQQLIVDYMNLQKYQLAETEERLKEYRAKLAKVTLVRKELKAHLQNLPDLSKLPNPSGLAPLPSAGDLFAKTG